MSKPGGISLPTELIMNAALICSKKVEWLHKQFSLALQQLEEQTVMEREIRLETIRKYRAMEESRVLSNQMESEEYHSNSNGEENSSSNVIGGIDRNDPILQWSYLHEPVSIREN